MKEADRDGPLKVWHRHLLTVLFLAGLTWLFTLRRLGLHPVHLWNRAFADASFVLLCLTLIIGPAVCFASRLSPLILWRRVLGIWCTIAAIIHVAIYAQGAYHWNPLGFFSRISHGQRVLLKNVFAVANWVGVVALLYAVVLALTSNDFSQRLLGQSAWKLLQQQNYTLFALTVLHAGVFQYAVIQRGRGIFPYALWAGVVFTVGMQIAGYVRTVLQHTGHPPSTEK